MITSILAGGIDDGFVLCGKSGIITLQEEHHHQLHIIMINLALILKCYRLGFFIRSLHQAYPHALRDELLHVLLTTIQTGLYHGANMLKLLVHAQRNIHRLLGIGRGFHIDTHKNLVFLGVLQDIAHILFAQLLGNIQSHGGQLNGDIGINSRLLDSIKNGDVVPGSRPGRPCVRNVFAEVVERDMHATLV